MVKNDKSKPVQKAGAKRTTTGKKPDVVKESMGKYINPLTDFGFKHIFGTKEFLIDFLNAVLGIEGGIVDLTYDNTERPGRSEDDRKTIFDLYCKLQNGEHIMIEMQYHRQDFFKDRTVYYASRLIQEQGEDKKGDKEWEYELKPVYSVNVVNFPLEADIDTVNNRKDKKHPVDKYATYAQLIDRDTHQVFYKKLTFVFLELPKFAKETNELTNYIDWWMYVLKNLATLDRLPDALRNEIFEQLFFKAEIAKLSKEERKKYDQSLKQLRDMNILLTQRDRKIADMGVLVTQSKRKIADMGVELTQNKRTIKTLSKENAAQAKMIAELKQRLGVKEEDTRN